MRACLKRFSPRHWKPAVIVVLAGMAIIGFATYSRLSFMSLCEAQRQEIEAEVMRTRTAFVSHVDRLLDYGDSTLRSVRAVYAHTHSNAAVLQHIAEAKAPRAAAFAGVVAGVDENGSVIFHTHDQSLLANKVNTSLEFFRSLQDDPRDRLYIDPTRVGRNTGLLQFRMIRPMVENGRFAGVVLLNVEPRLITDFYRSLNLGEHSISMLTTLDFRLLAREPAAKDYFSPVPGMEAWQALDLEAEPVGRLPTSVNIDGLPYTFYYARLKDYPLVAAIGVADEDAEKSLIAAERDFTWLTIGFTVTTVVVAGLLIAFANTNASLAAANETLNSAYRNLQRSNALLERSNADLEQFAFVASHDLQTPLRNIGSFAQLLDHRYGPQLDQDGREFLGFIVAGAQHMSGLVRDLLGYARVSSQGRTLLPMSASVAVAEAIDTLKDTVTASGAVIDVAPLPEILADSGQLEILFQNLIDNALKYRRPDVVPHVRIWAEPVDHGMWRFWVADNGIGIDPLYFDKIFVIFQRLHPVGCYPGTGIGLALCKRIVTRMGGEIGVESVPGEGARFHFTGIAADPAALRGT